MVTDNLLKEGVGTGGHANDAPLASEAGSNLEALEVLELPFEGLDERVQGLLLGVNLGRELRTVLPWWNLGG